MRSIVQFLLFPLLAAACTNASSSKRVSGSVENYCVEEKYDDTAYASSEGTLLQLVSIPENLWILNPPATVKEQIDDAMKCVLARLGYPGEEIDKPAGTVVGGSGGILHANSHGRKQSYVTEMSGDGETLIVNATIVSCYLLAAEGNSPRQDSGPLITVGMGDSTRNFLFPSPLYPAKRIYSPTVVLSLRMSAKAANGKYAQQTILISAVVGFKPGEMEKLKFKMPQKKQSAM